MLLEYGVSQLTSKDSSFPTGKNGYDESTYLV